MSRPRERHVVLVEDLPSDAFLFREYLAEADPARGRWRVSVVESVDALAKALEADPCDLVVTDLGLPGTRGVETFRRVREAAGETPVLVLTGQVDGEDGPRAVAEGASGFLVKEDLSPALLGYALERAVDRARLVLERDRGARALRRGDRARVAGRLVGGAAHDLNNLLTAILGNAQLLRADGSLGADARESVDEILSAGHRAAAVVRTLLGVARRRGGAGPIDLSASVTGLRPLLESAFGRRIDLRLELADDVPPVDLGPAAFGRVLLHLALNARDALPEGGTVAIATRRGAGGRGVLEVRDDGPGMDPETLERAIEPGFTTRPDAGAAGLGLAVVETIVVEAGGTIELESRPGAGTVARVVLPAADPDAAAGPDAAP